MSEEQLYWQKEDYEPTWEDVCTEWENRNGEYFTDYYDEISDLIYEHKDEWEWPYNPFVKACSENGGYCDFASKLTIWIEESEDFYNEMMEFLTGDLDAMKVVLDKTRYYKCDEIAEIYEGLRNREALRKQVEEAEDDIEKMKELISELQSDLEFYKNECSMKDEEINRLQEILDENGIAY